ncbi:hypothetical protein ABBQ38_002273 [Trebouxia sp. C0009 RCD-2024]
MGKGKTYFVSGSSRGVGLALVKELLSKPDERVVFAAARSPQKSEELQSLAKEHSERLHIITFDVTDGDSAKKAAEAVQKILGGKGLDVLINNAGTSEDLVPPLDTPDEKLKLTFMTNGVGPIIAYKYFRSLLEKGDTKMIVNFASNYGSMTLAAEPLKDRKKATPLDHTQIAYKASKAAVNMETVIMAEDTFDLGFTVISLHPGVVDTDMGSRPQEIVDTAKPEISPEGTAKAQVELYDKLTSKDTGKFFGYKGDVLPW